MIWETFQEEIRKLHKKEVRNHWIRSWNYTREVFSQLASEKWWDWKTILTFWGGNSSEAVLNFGG